MAFMTLENIAVCYDKKKQILKGLNLEVEKGEFLALSRVKGGRLATIKSFFEVK